MHADPSYISATNESSSVIQIMCGRSDV